MCSPPARAPCFHSLSVFSPMAAIRARVPPRRPPPPANGSLKSSSARRWRKSCRPERSRPDLTAVALHIGETDCVAEDAVLIGPVSAPDSLLTGKLTGNFADSTPLGRFLRLFGE